MLASELQIDMIKYIGHFFGDFEPIKKFYLFWEQSASIPIDTETIIDSQFIKTVSTQWKKKR